MKLLVCGGAGFIGSNFVRQRVNDHGDEVVVLDKLTYAGRPREPAGPRRAVTLVHGAIEDPEKVAEALGDGVDAIVNFAAETHVDRSISGPEAFVETNVAGRSSCWRPPASAASRYVQISTDEVYGSIEEGSFTEESPLRALLALQRVEGRRRPARRRATSTPTGWRPSSAAAPTTTAPTSTPRS